MNENELTTQQMQDAKTVISVYLGIDEFTLVLQPAHRVIIDEWGMKAEEMIDEFKKLSRIEEVFEEMELTNQQLIQGYTVCYRLAERPFLCCLCFNEGNEDMGVCVKFSATAYTMYKRKYYDEYHETMNLPKLLRMVQSNIYTQRLSRIDLTADYFNYPSAFAKGEYLHPNQIYSNLLQRQIKVTDHKGRSNIKTIASHNRDGIFETIYIGSKKKSNTFLRIYDKKQEQLDNHGYRYAEAENCSSWVRFEAVYRNTYAHQIGTVLMNNSLIQSDDDLQCFIAGKITDKYIFRKSSNDEALDFSEILLDIASGKEYDSLVCPSPRDNELWYSLFYIVQNSGLMITLAKADMTYAGQSADKKIMEWLYEMYSNYYFQRYAEGKRPEVDKWLKKHRKTAKDYPLDDLLLDVEEAVERGDNLCKDTEVVGTEEKEESTEERKMENEQDS